MTAPLPIHHCDGEALRRTTLRWSLAMLCIVAVHGGLVYAALNWPHRADVAAELPAAIMIELAPVPVAPDTPVQEVALGQQMQQSQEAAPSEQEDKPVEPEAKPEPVSDIESPPLPERPKAEAVLTQPPLPEPQKDKPKDDLPKPDNPKKAQKKPSHRKMQSAPATAAPKAANVERAPINAAAMAGTSSSVAPATWRNMVMALLNRHKRMPAGSGRGTATVAFTIDRSGRVVSARLVRSSGDNALDQEAVALARRVSPIPAPPANLGNGGSILLAVPVRFGE